jgi:hypothetical protein
MTEIIVTDLTRFQNDGIVCTAGIDLTSGKCIRPMPYIPTSECKRLNILPGAILSGKFQPASNLEGPHQEDMTHQNLSFLGPSSSDVFRQALEVGLYESIEEGFNIHLLEKQKHVPLGHDLKRSLITIKVNPRTIKVIEDSYKPGKLKLNFMDQSYRWFNYLPITDLGFHNYSMKKFKSNSLEELNTYISGQTEAYLRIGLGRVWNNGSIEGYWIQVNGIYTFPGFLEELRSYK